MILQYFTKLEAFIELSILWILLYTLEKSTIVFEKVYHTLKNKFDDF